MSIAALEAIATDHVVLLSSSRAQGLSDRNPGFLDESTRRAARDPEARAWRRFERAVSAAVSRNPRSPALTILRCCPVPGLPDAFAQLFEGGLLWVWAGFDPPIQLLALNQLHRVLLKMAERGPLPDSERGQGNEFIFHVAPDDAERLSLICRASGIVRVPVPGPLQELMSRRKGPGIDVRRYLLRPFTASNRRLLAWLDLPSLGQTLDAVEASPQREAALRKVSAAERDAYGMSGRVIGRLRRWVLEPARRWYWRVETLGIETFPQKGPAVLVGVHRGFMPLDAMMFLHLVATQTGRLLRTAIHPSLVKAPLFSWFLPAIGGRIATKDNADRTLREGHALAIYPEGADAAMAVTKEAYPLRPFLSIEFARLAVKHGAPVVPVVAIGPAETLPVFKRLNWRWWKKLTGWPTLPIGFLFPLGPPIPLPAKWHILFLEPVNPEEIVGDDDESRAQELARQVRTTLNEKLQELVEHRRSIWRGSIL